MIYIITIYLVGVLVSFFNSLAVHISIDELYPNVDRDYDTIKEYILGDYVQSEYSFSLILLNLFSWVSVLAHLFYYIDDCRVIYFIKFRFPKTHKHSVII